MQCENTMDDALVLVTDFTAISDSRGNEVQMMTRKVLSNDLLSLIYITGS